jgi:GTP-binding protein
MYGHVLADIPGLIEGASDGKGLGHKFLRHIKRTKMLVHCISLENEDVVEVYKTVRKEIESFDPLMKEKEEIILLTKSDIYTPTELEDKFKKLKKTKEWKGKDILTVSVYDIDSLKKLTDFLIKKLK